MHVDSQSLDLPYLKKHLFLINANSESRKPLNAWLHSDFAQEVHESQVYMFALNVLHA